MSRAWLSATLCFMFDGGGNNRLYNLWWVLLIGAVMWWALRGATGYSPLRKPHQTDSWVLNEARVLGETQTPAPAPAQAQAFKR